jgi:G:T-mismatch repair DNA endonuclease (very short patch repair protein)
MKRIKKKKTWWDKLTQERQQEIIEKRRQGYQEWWNTLSEEKKNEKREKYKVTCLKKYGVSNAAKITRFLDKRKQTNLQRYGTEHPIQLEEIKEKRKKNSLGKYGVEYPIQLESVKEKMAKTNLKKYGTKSSMQAEKVKKKRDKNNIDKYGVSNVMQMEEIKEKVKNTCQDKYGAPNFFLSKQYQDEAKKDYYVRLFTSSRLQELVIPQFSLDEFIGTKNSENGFIYYPFKCTQCGTVFNDNIANSRIPRCHKCYPVSTFTKPHQIICDYLDVNEFPYEIEKYIRPYFADIFMSPNKIIEVYGDYWHGNPELYNKNDVINHNNEDCITVYDKWQKDKERITYLKQQGYQILIIWEKEIKENISGVNKQIRKFLKNDSS